MEQLMVYGAGEHLRDMLIWHPDLASKVIRLFDKNRVGDMVPSIVCEVESPEALATVPEGTLIAVSAIKYFKEIQKEIRHINKGLICKPLDTVYQEMQFNQEMNGVRAELSNSQNYVQNLQGYVGSLQNTIKGLQQLHESVVQKTWPHDGSMKKYVCKNPFERIDIFPDGAVWTCCALFLRYNYYLGNIKYNTMEEIWNSDRAKKLRKSVAEGNFEYCTNYCEFLAYCKSDKKNAIQDGSSPLALRKDSPYANLKSYELDFGPKFVNLTCDETCNLTCPSCRSALKVMPREESEKLYDYLMKSVFPMLDNCESFWCLGSGDVFASHAVYSFVKNITHKRFPKLGVGFITNLLLFNEKKWQELEGLHDAPTFWHVSVDASTKETYEINRRGGKWETLLANLRYLSHLRKSGAGNIQRICLNIVVQRNNYKEIPGLIALAEEIGADQVELQRLANIGTFSPDEFLNRNVFDAKNPEHDEFIAFLKDVKKIQTNVAVTGNVLMFAK